jgi:hypothetical protein
MTRDGKPWLGRAQNVGRSDLKLRARQRPRRTRGGSIQTLYAKRGQITMPRLLHRIGGRRAKPTGLPEPTKLSVLEPFACILSTFANVEGTVSASRPDLIDSRWQNPRMRLTVSGEPARLPLWVLVVSKRPSAMSLPAAKAKWCFRPRLQRSAA